MTAAEDPPTPRLDAGTGRTGLGPLLEGIVASALDGIICIDDAESIVLANPAAERLFGYAPGTLLGRKLDVLIPEVSREAHHHAVEAFARSGVSHRAMGPQNALLGLRADGTTVPLEISISQAVVEGRTVSAAILRDMTDARRALGELREQAAILEMTPTAIVLEDAQEKVLFWSRGAEALFGWTPEEARGRVLGELQGTPDTQVAAARAAVAAAGHWEGELSARAKDGKELLVESRKRLLRDAAGAPHRVLTVESDVTEKRAVEAQLLRVQRLESVGTLASGIAHDLNNVLQPIVMGLDTIVMTHPDETTRSVVEAMQRQALRGSRVIQQVLSFARGMATEMRRVDLRQVLREVEQMMRETMPRSIDIRVSVPEDLWWVRGDVTQIHQVVMNLCVNARDAMPRGGVLTLTAANEVFDEIYARMHIEARPQGYIVLTVEDTGSGMPPEVVERIFEPFFTTKEPGKGTGLGLSLTRTIVKNHHGFINVHSEVGKGSSFQVCFPALPAHAVREEGTRETLPRGHGELVLVVDDEPDVRRLAVMVLQASGYKAVEAADGTEALAVLAERRTEVRAAIIDSMMPTMDGISTIRIMRKLNPGVAIVATSGLPDAEGVESKGVAADVFLTKPSTAAALLGALRGLLPAGASEG